ncbi:MAG: AsmA family protein, partial [Deltaproteobacteria bacterium]|nr:AsmA family protein [Deltaproteobacteria bacterium]
MMKKMLLIGLGVLLVVIVALGALPFLVDLNQHKQRIISLIEPALGRKVTVEDIQLTVLEGLGAELSGLRIAENPLFGEQDFITLQALKIRVKLRPLLQKRIEVKKIIVDRPVLRIVRNEGGQLNISDLGRRENEEKSGAPGGAGQGPTAPGGALAAGLLVSDCLIRGGEIHILDAGGAG